MNYEKEILDLLTGKSLCVPRERVDWAGLSELMDIWDSRDGVQRTMMIKAIKKILRRNTDVAILAQLVWFARQMAIRAVRGEVKALQGKTLTRNNAALAREIENYLARSL